MKFCVIVKLGETKFFKGFTALRSASRVEIFVVQILARDLFAVANVVVVYALALSFWNFSVLHVFI